MRRPAPTTFSILRTDTIHCAGWVDVRGGALLGPLTELLHHIAQSEQALVDMAGLHKPVTLRAAERHALGARQIH